jgi:hypothetical protein
MFLNNINHSPFSLHTFSIAEKVCKKARQKGASAHKAIAGPHFCRANPHQNYP